MNVFALLNHAMVSVVLAWSSVSLVEPQAGSGDSGGITVTGVGEVLGAPTSVEIDVRATGSAELTADALVKYRDSKRRTLEAFGNLKLAALKTDVHSMTVTNTTPGQQQQVIFPGGQQPTTKSTVEIASTIRVTLQDMKNLAEDEIMETIARLLDTAKDAGAVVGDPEAANRARYYGQSMNVSLATFVLDNVSALREQAYQQAIAETRERATRLAELAGVKIGAVLSIQELAAPTDSQQQVAYYPWQQPSGGNDRDKLRIRSPQYNKIPVRVNLMVRFAIAK